MLTKTNNQKKECKTIGDIAGFFKENLQLHNSSSLPSLPSLPALSSLPSLPFPPSLLSLSPPLPLLAGVWGYHPGNFLEIEMLVGEF